MSVFPESFRINPIGHLERMDPRLYDQDPRGLLWMWEPFDPRFQYICGIDPTVGQTNWRREVRTGEDKDNGAIIILKKGQGPLPDTQVAEYAAPNDPFELGTIAQLMCGIYTQGDDQPLCIIEVQPGPGAGTLHRMRELGYENFWHWEYYGNELKQTRAIGWHASTRTNLDLWVKGSRYINLRRAIVRSPWLYEECAEARINEHLYAEVERGSGPGHGDRLRAFLLTLWAANRWAIDSDFNQPLEAKTQEPVEWAATDMSIEEIQEAWNDAVDRMMPWN